MPKPKPLAEGEPDSWVSKNIKGSKYLFVAAEKLAPKLGKRCLTDVVDVALRAILRKHGVTPPPPLGTTTIADQLAPQIAAAEARRQKAGHSGRIKPKGCV